MEWESFFLSLQLASVTSLILVVCGVPLTFFLAQKNGPLKTVLEVLCSLPLVLPPTVLGFYLLLVLSPLHLAFTFTGLVVASCLSSLPLAFQAFLAGFETLDKNWIETARTLGATQKRTFFKIAIPLCQESILAGIVLAFAHTLGEFGVVLMIGGNLPGLTRTLSVSLFDQVESADYEAAHRTALVLLTLSFLALLAVSVLRRQKLAPANRR